METYFADVLPEKQCNTTLLAESVKQNEPSSEDETRNDFFTNLSPSEVATKLGSTANTSPGADRVEYAYLKKIDPSVKILTLMFNRCMRQKDVPSPWKEALTMIIYKKGEDTDVSNLRPIALMSCIYKLFMVTMAKRLTKWSTQTGILSEKQKSAQPSEGCYEHTYILKSWVGQAWRNKRLSLA